MVKRILIILAVLLFAFAVSVPAWADTNPFIGPKPSNPWANPVNPTVTGLPSQWLESWNPNSTITLTWPNIKFFYGNILPMTGFATFSGKYTAEVNGNSITIHSGGNGAAAGIQIPPAMGTSWESVGIAGAYMTLQNVSVSPGQAVFTVHAQMAPDDPTPVVGQTVSLNMQPEGFTSQYLNMLDGWPSTIATVGTGVTDSNGNTTITVKFFILEPIGAKEVDTTNGNGYGIPSLPVYFVAFLQTPGVTADEFPYQWAQLNSNAGIDSSTAAMYVPVLSTLNGDLGPGNVSNSFEITPQFLDQVFSPPPSPVSSPPSTTAPPSGGTPTQPSTPNQPGAPASPNQPGQPVGTVVQPKQAPPPATGVAVAPKDKVVPAPAAKPAPAPSPAGPIAAVVGVAGVAAAATAKKWLPLIPPLRAVSVAISLTATKAGAASLFFDTKKGPKQVVVDVVDQAGRVVAPGVQVVKGQAAETTLSSTGKTVLTAKVRKYRNVSKQKSMEYDPSV